MSWNKGDKVYHFPNNHWENGIKKSIVDENVNGVIYCNDYQDNFPEYSHVFCRRENAMQAMALLRDLAMLKIRDEKRHLEDVREAEEYHSQVENRAIGVIDVITQDLGKGVVRYDREGFRDLAVNAGKDPRWGVLDLGSVKVVASESSKGVYYPVSRDACGCPSWYYRLRIIGGRCKHMQQYFPE